MEGIFLTEEKNFKTIDEQLKILKSRGLNIPDETYAYNYLLTNNYYNIINGYSKYFMENNKQKYLNEASFNEISSLYFFDKQIKKTFFEAILNCEHHLKAIFAYRFSESFPNEKYAYLDINNYSKDKVLEVGYIISRISKIIKNNIKYANNAIYHYVEKYHDVPVWVLIDFLDFGILKKLIECMPVSIQNKIAVDLTRFIKDNNSDFNETFTPESMIKFIKNIHETRNICAHNNRLIEFKCRSNSIYFKFIHEKSNLTNDNSRKSPYSTFISLQCFLSKTEFSTLNNTIRKRIKNLDNKLSSININSIICLLGFPDDWHQKDKINQQC